MEVSGEKRQEGEVDCCCEWGGEHCNGEDEGEEALAVAGECCVGDWLSVGNGGGHLRLCRRRGWMGAGKGGGRDERWSLIW